MLKLIAFALGIWLLWGYGFLPPFSVIRHIAMPYLEKAEKLREEWAILRAQEEEAGKRKKAMAK